MSSDSSRHVTVRSGEPVKRKNDSSTSKPPSNPGVVAQGARQPPFGVTDTNNSPMTVQPGSGRPSIARLPIVEKSVYRIEGEVAQGGIGRVLSARDERLDRRVAVKVLLEESGAYEDRFVREALVTARLQHPSIVPVYEAGRWPSGEAFYSMKLVSGKPLLDILEQSRNIDERLPLLPRILAVADAVAYAHERRIIHRDLKPANILLGAHGETILIDWGLAKDLREAYLPSAVEMTSDPNVAIPENNTLTIVGSVMGTPSYMPPEQAAGDMVDERADVYALGAILYHVLSGKQPYAGYSGMQTIMRVLQEPPRALEAIQIGIPRDLLTIVDKAMHRDRDVRYPSAKEFAEDLRRFLAGQLVGAHHYSSKERLLRFLRKHRTAFGVAAVAVVLLLINGALFVSRIIQERDRAENEKNRAEIARKQAIAAEERATVRADELTLVEARAAVERDPNAALAWLKALSPAFSKWNAARVIAADAWTRGTSTSWHHHRATINGLELSTDEKRLFTVSDDHTARILDLATNESRVLEGHTDEVWSVGISTDEQRIVTGGKDRTIRIWDVKTGQWLRTLEGHTGPIVSTKFSRDDKLIFSQSDDCSLRVWDLATGKSRILASGPKVSLKSIMGPDERHFVTVGNEASVWHLEMDHFEPRRISELSVNTSVEQVMGRYPVSFSSDGRRVLAGGADGLVREWDFEAESVRVFEGQTSPITRIAYSPDDKLIAASSFDGTMRLWDRSLGTTRVLPAHEANVSVLLFSPDGRILASGGYDKSVRVFDLSTGSRRRFVGMQDSVVEMRFTKDISQLIVGSGEGAVRVFRLQQDAGRLLGRHQGIVWSVDVSSQGDSVVTSGADGLVRLWPIREKDSSPQILSGHIGFVPFVKFSPNGQLILSSGIDGTVRVWDRSGHQVTATYMPGRMAPRIAFSPDGHTVALGNTEGSVQIWDIDSGVLRPLGAHARAIAYLSFSPDGRKLGTGSVDRIAKVWDLESATATDFQGHEDAVSWISFSPDGRTLATGSADHRLRLWDLGANEPRTYDASGYNVLGLSFLPDGTSIVGFSAGGLARLWDVSSGKTMRLFRGHRGSITSLALAKDGAVFATSSDDRTIRLYDLESGESRVMGMHDAPARAVGIDPHGQWAVSVGDDGAVRLWSDDLPREPEPLRAWIASSVAEVIDVNALGAGSIPLP
ncbi:MAG TPA: serine/threonine-protein kinase [Polyangium sp.]|nr:serine/threonine-protein kinase [Polyangium sp.]